MITIAIISFTIPDEVLGRVKLALGHGTALSNAEAKQVIVNWVVAKVKNYESDQATKKADAEARADVDSDIILS